MNKFIIVTLLVTFQSAYAAEEGKIENPSSLEELDDGEMNSVTAQFATAEGLQKNIDSKNEEMDINTNTGVQLNSAYRSNVYDGLRFVRGARENRPGIAH